MDAKTNPIELCGTVAAVIYQNEENGYTVLKLDVDDGSQTMVVGCIPYAVPGESMIVTGSWMTHPVHGQQFKAEFAERTMPETADAIYAYLAGRAVHGIGPATASLLVSRFGADTLNVLEYEPEKLTAIKGISLSKAKTMSANFRRQAGMRRLIEFLASANIRPVIALRMYQYYGDVALQLVQDNPYILVSDAIGATFQEADALALGHGFDDQSAERVAAATLYELAYNAIRGHCFISYRNLLAATSQLSGVPDELVAQSVDTLVESGELVRERVAGCDGCYLARLHEAEAYTAERLLAMAQNEYRRMPDTEKIAAQIEAQLGLTFAEQQKETLRLACQHQVIAITGGPGTGKTTSIRAILALFDVLKLDTQLAAPTGRAAKRMSELTGRSAQTIHRLLEAGMSDDHQDIAFRRDEDDPLACDAVILDECSMVDISLMCALLRAMRPDCRLILVGDADQLPSVGPSNVFSDIIRSGVIPTVRLTEIFRQAAGSSIVAYAHAINRGEHPNLAQNSGDFFFLRRTDPQKAADTVVELCKTRLPNNMKIPPSDIQVLTPTRKYDTGMAALNVRLQAALNPPADGKKERRFGEIIFREGYRVMQIRNDYDIVLKNPDGTTAGTGVYNGDVGQITAIDPQTETLAVCYDGKTATYGFEMLNELEHAWVMTVHKSQGSEYRAVVLCIGKAGPMLLTRSVLYTAITRAKSLLIVVGDEGVAYHMIDNQAQTRRYSGLRARLCGECGEA